MSFLSITKAPADPAASQAPNTKRYLLFDAGCSECTEIAQAVEQETEGWLTALSLREKNTQELLSKARPGWRWEPTLLEVDGDKISAFTGLPLKLRMLVGLGPLQAARVAKAARKPSSSRAFEIEMNADTSEGSQSLSIETINSISRRKALKVMGALSLGAILPFAISPQRALAQGKEGSVKATSRELIGAEARRAALKARRNVEGGLLWAYLVRQGFAEEASNAEGSAISIVEPSGNVEKGFVVQVPFQARGNSKPVLLFSKVGDKVKTGIILYKRTGDEVSSAEIFEVRQERVIRTETIEDPQKLSGSVGSSEGIRTAQATRCSICNSVVDGVVASGCGISGFLVCNAVCAPFAGLVCGGICTVVFAIICTYGGDLRSARLYCDRNFCF